MTIDELKAKIDTACQKCRSLKALPLSKIKHVMDSQAPESEKLYYRLEYSFRINGGLDPYLTILIKMQKEWGCELKVIPPYVEILKIK
jgi:hypothetical protein